MIPATRLSQLDSCAVSDALDALGLPGYVDGLLPQWTGARLAGRVVTVALAAGEAPADAAPLHLGGRAIARGKPGDVIVIDNHGRTGMGGWGGLLSLAAAKKGIGGVVLDGACRDVDEARELGFPVFARAGVARTARGRVHEVSCGAPIEIAGVGVCHGDYILADGSGVVVIAAEHVDQVLDLAEAIARREQALAARLNAGESPLSVLGIDYEALLADES